jgi:hypothetical protein
MLHVLISEKEHLDNVRNATGKEPGNWVVPKNAKPGERLALFFPSEKGIVALGEIRSKPEGPTMRGDRIVYLSEIGNVVALSKTITIDDLKECPVEEIKDWPWLWYPRNFTTLKPPRSQKLLEILKAKAPKRASQKKQAQPPRQAKPPPASRAEQAQAREKAEMEAMDGIVKERKYLSRNKRLHDEAKRLAKGWCYTCETNFSELLGGLGERVLEAHHKNQLASKDRSEPTKVKELAVVCANCHRMIHEDPKNAMKVDELRRRIRQARMG